MWPCYQVQSDGDAGVTTGCGGSERSEARSGPFQKSPLGAAWGEGPRRGLGFPSGRGMHGTSASPWLGMAWWPQPGHRAPAGPQGSCRSASGS